MTALSLRFARWLATLLALSVMAMCSFAPSAVSTADNPEPKLRAIVSAFTVMAESLLPKLAKALELLWTLAKLSATAILALPLILPIAPASLLAVLALMVMVALAPSLKEIALIWPKWDCKLSSAEPTTEELSRIETELTLTSLKAVAASETFAWVRLNWYPAPFRAEI